MTAEIMDSSGPERQSEDQTREGQNKIQDLWRLAAVLKGLS